MLWQPTELVASGLAALVLAAVFLLGGRMHPLHAVTRDQRKMVSFCAGMASAYVFVHVMPELQIARHSLVASESPLLRFEGKAIYIVALIGFLAFYGLHHLRAQLSNSSAQDHELAAYKLEVRGFAAYVALVGYLLVRNLEETPVAIGLFTAAMAVHFLAVDHSLSEEHGTAYTGRGRSLLAAMVVLGWVAGQLIDLPTTAVALLVAFLSGAVIVNSSLMELPTEKEGRFLPFLVGGLLYALILLPLG
jgi:hypothetical protein